jgi:8-oxo-dGTP pyrophosphatase MutT (NUDIX family)
MSIFQPEYVKDCLAAQPDLTIDFNAPGRRAAVAIVLVPHQQDTQALFILRATKKGDPWSGQMAFPGGHYEPEDKTLRVTAERETLEEVGLDLARSGHYLGSFSPVKANPRGNLDMLVVPQVFALETKPEGLQANYEVAEILWGDLGRMLDRQLLTQSTFPQFNRSTVFPGYQVGKEVVWGLTFRMLNEFFSLLVPDWQAPPD